MAPLAEIDALEVLVIIDNELDPALKYVQPPAVEAFGNVGQIGMASPNKPKDRGQDCRELKMEQICCGAHGLSLMIVSILSARRVTMQGMLADVFQDGNQGWSSTNCPF
jgi:7,8-dihydropterin-6-yl-methyl-4-(beta-D-ribofuranosyl)aminobenzene 5'-phosphate synthase